MFRGASCESCGTDERRQAKMRGFLVVRAAPVQRRVSASRSPGTCCSVGSDTAQRVHSHVFWRPLCGLLAQHARLFIALLNTPIVLAVFTLFACPMRTSAYLMPCSQRPVSCAFGCVDVMATEKT